MSWTSLFNIREYNKQRKTAAQYIGLSFVQRLEILWYTICIVDQIVHSTL